MTAFEHNRPQRDDRPKDGRDLRFAGGLSIGLVSAILAGGALIAPVSGGLNDDDAPQARTAGNSVVKLPAAVRTPPNAGKPGGPNLATPIAPTPAPVGGAALSLSALVSAPAAALDALRRSTAHAAAAGTTRARHERSTTPRGSPTTSASRARRCRDGPRSLRVAASATATAPRTMAWRRSRDSRSREPGEDFDGDGVPNWAEWRLRTDPTERGRRLRRRDDGMSTATGTVCATASRPRPAPTR